MGSVHVTLLHEAESQLDEVAYVATVQFHVYHGTDQLILFHKNTFEPGGVMIERVIQDTTKQDTFGLKYLMSRTTPEQGKGLPLLVCVTRPRRGEESRKCLCVCSRNPPS